MNARARLISFSLVAGLLLAGCDALQLGVETATPPAPSMPATAATVAAITTAAATTAPPASPAKLAATATLHVVLSTQAPTAGPVASPTSPPTVVPGSPHVPEVILILNPGNSSSVTSPVRVTGEADPTFEQNLVVQISDANGKVIATKPATIQGLGAVRGPFDVQVPFAVAAAGPGRISVFSTSARDGGLVHLASVEVTLLNGGAAAATTGPIHNETYIILQPAPRASVSGGRLHVTGFSDYVFEGQLSLALCGQGGSGTPEPICGTADNMLASGTATITAPDVGQPGPFAGDLTYHVSATVQARLVVFSRSARDGGLVHLTTVVVQLAP